jgi:hypothetical protein
MKGRNPPGQSDDGSSVVVYRTGILYEADMVADAMTRAGIPFFRRKESIGGLSFAMPAAPSMAPGDIWAIVVPGTWADRAKHFVAELPVPRAAEQGVRGFQPPEKLLIRWSWVLVVGLALVFIWTIVLIFTE